MEAFVLDELLTIVARHYLTGAQAAELLGLSAMRVSQLHSEGKLARLELPSPFGQFYSRRAVEALAEERRINPPQGTRLRTPHGKFTK